MTDKGAALYARRGAIYVITDLQTEVGLWIGHGPCIELDRDAPATEVGDAVILALSRSGRIIPHPTEWKNPDDDNPVLLAAGIKRWSTFNKGARCVNIALSGDEYIISPTKNEGRDGFVDLPGERLPGTIDAAELGQAIQRALALSS